MQPWRSTFFTNGAILGAGLISGVLVARFLGVEDRGLLAAIIYWPHFIAGVAALGLNEGIVIQTAKNGITSTLKITTLTLSLAIASIAGVVGFVLMPFLIGESRQEYLLFSQVYLLAFIPFTYLAQNFLAIDQGEFKFQRFNAQRVLQAVMYPMLLLVFWAAGILTVEHAAIAILAGTAVVAALRVWRVRKDLCHHPSKNEAIQLLAVSVRLHVVNIAMFLALQMDKMALVLFSNNIELGVYVVASTAAGALVSLVVQTYINIMLPSAAQLGTNLESIQQIIVPLRQLVGAIVLSTVMLVLVMPSLITFVFGIEFEEAGAYARILLVAFAFLGVKKVFVYVLRSWNKNSSAFLAEGLAALILIAGAYVVLQSWGTIGLCVLVVVAHAVGASFIGHHFLKAANLTLRQFMGFEPIAVL